MRNPALVEAIQLTPSLHQSHRGRAKPSQLPPASRRGSGLGMSENGALGVSCCGNVTHQKQSSKARFCLPTFHPQGRPGDPRQPSTGHPVHLQVAKPSRLPLASRGGSGLWTSESGALAVSCSGSGTHQKQSFKARFFLPTFHPQSRPRDP